MRDTGLDRYVASTTVELDEEEDENEDEAEGGRHDVSERSYARCRMMNNTKKLMFLLYISCCRGCL